jgi:hypothetical protein
MAGENWTFWLNMTNFALGIITVLALVVVFCAVSWDLLVRKVHHARELGTTDISKVDEDLRAMLEGSHSLSVPGLGLTMADGGERVETSKPEAAEEKPRK